MTGAQALVRQLRSEGVDTIFAVPGVQVMGIFDALYDIRDEIRLIQARHEQATTYMASGYAKVTGKVGVAVVVPGPGALNATAGLGTAYATSSPVLLISGQIPSLTLGESQGQLHEIDDQLDVFRPITKWVHRITKGEDVPAAVHEAMRQLKTGRPRPVELEIPPDILETKCEANIIEAESYPRLKGNPLDIQRAVQLLIDAKKPAIIAGGGTAISQASRELLELATYIQAPVMTTQQAKGVIPEDHYLAIGVNYALLGPIHQVALESDVILAVGTRFLISGLQLTDSQRIIHIDIDPTQIGKTYSTDVGIEADAQEALGQLIQHLRSTVPPKKSRRKEIESYKSAFTNKVRNLATKQTDIVDIIRQELNDNAIVVSGITNIGYWSNLAYPVRKLNTYITSSYFATLGFAFPTALGAKAAYPDRQVVAICGDGGFMYSPQELSVAVMHGINVVTLVFNNDAYGASQWDQTHRYRGRYIGTDLYNPDFVKLAESFGAVGMRTDLQCLSSALRKSLALNAPVLLEVIIPNMMPPFQIV